MTEAAGRRSQVLERWRRERKARLARWMLVRLLPQISLRLTCGILVTVLASALASAAFIVATGTLIGTVATTTEARDSAALVRALVAVAIAFISRQLLSPVQTQMVETLGRRVDGHLRARVAAAMLAQPTIAHLEDAALQDLVRDAQGIGTGQFTPGAAVRGIVENATLRLSGLAAALLVASFSWWLAGVIVAFVLVVRYRVVDDLLRTVQRGTGQTTEMRRSDYVRDLALRPEAAKETRVFGLGQWLLERFSSSWNEGMSAIWRDRKANSSVSSWTVPWGVLTFASLYLVGRAGASGELSLRELAIVAQAVISAGSIWLSQGDILAAYGATALPALGELEHSVAVVKTGHQPSRRAPATSTETIPRREIRFESVSFRYPGRDHDVFTALDLVIPAGRSVAIVGANGAGKTTLVKLLAGLYQPTSGRIRVDESDLRDLDPAAWQRRIAAIFQDFIRYELSARLNVGFGRVEHADDADAIRAAASLVGAERAIEQLPLGWETVLSKSYSDGADLSGGEWQKVALARAVFALQQGAGVLILDEPTANLDVRAEAELFDRFLEITRGATTILISHRFSSVRHADLIYVLEERQVRESGTHEQLLVRQGRYAHMFQLQAARFADKPEEEPV